jgi:phage baseplate assembly protein W
MAGLGGFSLGSTPFGAGTPSPAAAPPDAPLQEARFIDPVTKDYVVGADGEYLAMPSVRQRMVLALGMTLGSAAALQEAGLQLPDRIDERFPQRSEQAIRRAVEFMVLAGEVRIDAVEIIPSDVTGRTEHLVSFTDLTTGNSDTLTV